MSKLTELPNIGKVLEISLTEIGIETEEELRQIGSKETWLKLKEKDKST